MTNNLRIHPTAVVSKEAVLADSVTVGPYSVIGPQVRVDEGLKYTVTL